MGRSFGLASSSLVVVCPVSRTPNGGKPVTRFSCLKKDSRRGPTAGRVRFSRPWMTGHIQESYKGLNRLEEEALLGRKFLRTLLIDNYDSYTYNIYQELSVVNGGQLQPSHGLFFCKPRQDAPAMVKLPLPERLLSFHYYSACLTLQLWQEAPFSAGCDWWREDTNWAT